MDLLDSPQEKKVKNLMSAVLSRHPPTNGARVHPSTSTQYITTQYLLSIYNPSSQQLHLIHSTCGTLETFVTMGSLSTHVNHFGHSKNDPCLRYLDIPCCLDRFRRPPWVPRCSSWAPKIAPQHGVSIFMGSPQFMATLMGTR